MPAEPPVAPPDVHDSRTRIAGLQGHGVTALAVVAVIGGLKLGEGFLVPVALAIVIALALARPVRRLQNWMPRWVASGLVMTVLVGSLGFMAYSLIGQAAAVLEALPRATRILRTAFGAMASQNTGALSQLRRAVTELERAASESATRPVTPRGVTPVQVVEPPVNFANVVWLGSQGVLLVAAQLMVVLLLVYFLLAYGNLFKRKIVRLSGERLSQRRVTVQMIDQIGENVSRSFFHLGLASLVVGLSTWAVLAWMQVNYAALWGLAAGVLNVVPYIGPVVVACGLLLAGLVQFGEIGPAAGTAAVSLIVTTVEGSLFTPIVFGHTVRINPVAVFVAVLFWGWLWGLWGVLLALPLLVIVKTIAESVDDLKPLAELLGD